MMNSKVMMLTLAVIFVVYSAQAQTIAKQLSQARVASGQYISWREHLIDGEQVNLIKLRGADGLAIADFDGDNQVDIVSVHEDSHHIRLAFANETLDSWTSITLAKYELAKQAEDADIADFDNDGDLDIIIALEGGGLVAFNNLGKNPRLAANWQVFYPENSKSRGSFIRVAALDHDQDGKPSVVAANKGVAHNKAGKLKKPGLLDYLKVYLADPLPISLFSPSFTDGFNAPWQEQVLAKVRMPINAEPVDIDGDGDIDIVIGGRGHQGLLLLVNSQGKYQQQWLDIDGWWEILSHGLPFVTGQTLAFSDVNQDGRLDIITQLNLDRLGWLEQPESLDGAWQAHVIGQISPDHIAAIVPADIDGDGIKDILVGGYSKGNRQQDELTNTATSPLGRLAWFKVGENTNEPWQRYDISRRIRGMYDDFIPLDIDNDGDLDFVGTRGNSGKFDGVIWLEQRRTLTPEANFSTVRGEDSKQVELATNSR